MDEVRFCWLWGKTRTFVRDMDSRRPRDQHRGRGKFIAPGSGVLTNPLKAYRSGGKEHSRGVRYVVHKTTEFVRGRTSGTQGL